MDTVIGHIREVLEPLPAAARRTITFDQGFEFLAYRMLLAPAYFCDP